MASAPSFGRSYVREQAVGRSPLQCHRKMPMAHRLPPPRTRKHPACARRLAQITPHALRALCACISHCCFYHLRPPFRANFTCRVFGYLSLGSSDSQLYCTPRSQQNFSRVRPRAFVITACIFSRSADRKHTVALEVGGSHARSVWGSQWIKLMALLYDGITTDPSPLGGSGLEARASRVRLQLEIERVMGSG